MHLQENILSDLDIGVEVSQGNTTYCPVSPTACDLSSS